MITNATYKLNNNVKNENSLSENIKKHLTHVKSMPFAQVTQNTQALKSCLELGAQLKTRYTHFVIIGIGGSSMGARAIAEISQAHHILFLDNVDAVAFHSLFHQIKDHLHSTAFIVVSKSGSTIEILWNYNFCAEECLKSQINIIEHSYFISETQSNPLSDFAQKHQRPLLEVPLNIGGRFSVLTPVGLLIADLTQLDLNLIYEGAKQALKDDDLLCRTAQAYLESFDRNETISLFWFYNSQMRWFGGWLQQLWAESLGKKTDRSGQKAPAFSTPMIAIGSCDQHSILQQISDGPRDKFVSIYRFKTIETSTQKSKTQFFQELHKYQNLNYGDLIRHQSQATYLALRESQVSCEIVEFDDSCSSQTLGYLFMFFELLVATLGESQNINSFDQPGVALVKQKTLQLLDQTTNGN